MANQKNIENDLFSKGIYQVGFTNDETPLDEYNLNQLVDGVLLNNQHIKDNQTNVESVTSYVGTIGPDTPHIGTCKTIAEALSNVSGVAYESVTDVRSLDMSKMDKLPKDVPDEILVSNSDGNSKVSGKKLSDFASATLVNDISTSVASLNDKINALDTTYATDTDLQTAMKNITGQSEGDVGSNYADSNVKLRADITAINNITTYEVIGCGVPTDDCLTWTGEYDGYEFEEV